MEFSKTWYLNHKDWIKTVVMLIGSAAVASVLSFVKNKTAIDWHEVTYAVLVAVLTYIGKQTGTDAKGDVVAVKALTGLKTGPEAGDNNIKK